MAGSESSNEVRRGEKKINSSYEKKKKTLLKWLQSITFSSVQAETESEPRSSEARRSLTLVYLPDKLKQKR